MRIIFMFNNVRLYFIGGIDKGYFFIGRGSGACRFEHVSTINILCLKAIICLETDKNIHVGTFTSIFCYLYGLTLT